jgi:hypothetical protein
MIETLDQYFREVKKLLPCSAKEKERCVIELESDVSAYLENKPNASLKDLYADIGSPESIADSFLSRLTPKQLTKKLIAKCKLVAGIACAVALMATALNILSCLFPDKLGGSRR